MIALLGMIVFASWFYMAAQSVNKSGFFWAVTGLGIYFIMGFILLVISDAFILKADTMAEALEFRWLKALLEFISMIIIFGMGFFIQHRFLSKRSTQERIPKKA